jgi:hypothetical protein
MTVETGSGHLSSASIEPQDSRLREDCEMIPDPGESGDASRDPTRACDPHRFGVSEPHASGGQRNRSAIGMQRLRPRLRWDRRTPWTERAKCSWVRPQHLIRVGICDPPACHDASWNSLGGFALGWLTKVAALHRPGRRRDDRRGRARHGQEQHYECSPADHLSSTPRRDRWFPRSMAGSPPPRANDEPYSVSEDEPSRSTAVACSPSSTDDVGV